MNTNNEHCPHTTAGACSFCWQAERDRAEVAIKILRQYRHINPKIICPHTLIDVVLEALSATQPDPLKIQGPYISATQPPVGARSTPKPNL